MSNKIERYIRKFYKKNKNVEIEIPLTLKGKKKIVGYPDLYVNTEKESFYLEIKLFGKSQKHQSLRSFYLSTIDKITKTCPHILLAFEHKDKRLTGHYKIVDMYNVTLKLKEEYWSSNKMLYL
jgi:hypothetical protein